MVSSLIRLLDGKFPLAEAANNGELIIEQKIKSSFICFSGDLEKDFKATKVG